MVGTFGTKPPHATVRGVIVAIGVVIGFVLAVFLVAAVLR